MQHFGPFIFTTEEEIPSSHPQQNNRCYALARQPSRPPTGMLSSSCVCACPRNHPSPYVYTVVTAWMVGSLPMMTHGREPCMGRTIIQFARIASRAMLELNTPAKDGWTAMVALVAMGGAAGEWVIGMLCGMGTFVTKDGSMAIGFTARRSNQHASHPGSSSSSISSLCASSSSRCSSRCSSEPLLLLFTIVITIHRFRGRLLVGQ